MAAARAEKGKGVSMKRSAILKAATEIFLQDGYLGASMDRIAALAIVSKQTVYSHYQSKEALFIAVVESESFAVGRLFDIELSEPQSPAELFSNLVLLGESQLSGVLQERNMRLGRLVIGESIRFPEFGRALYAGGTTRDLQVLASVISGWQKLGLLATVDPRVAATEFKGLLFSELLQRALFLGGEGLPTPSEIHERAERSAKAFLAMYGCHTSGSKV